MTLGDDGSTEGAADGSSDGMTLGTCVGADERSYVGMVLEPHEAWM